MQFVAPQLFSEAVTKIGTKTPIGSDLSSSQWADVPLAMRERAFFSARVESVRFLQRARDSVTDFLSSSREVLPSGETALKTGGRADFVARMKDLLAAEGIERTSGGLTDITSQKRLELIFNTQVQQAHDFGYWKQGMDPDVLDAFPAQRFVRVKDVKEPRNWHTQFEDQVRLKSDLQYWKLANKDFGVPWGPWGWGCGHDVEDVDRSQAEALGLIRPEDQVKPVVQEFNHELEASTRGLDPDMVQRLKDSFGDQVEWVGDSVQWRAGGSPPRQSAKSAPPAATLPPSVGTATVESVLQKVGLADGKTATAEHILALREELKEDHPLQVSQVVRDVHGASASGVLSSASIKLDVQRFLDYIPAHKAQALPKLSLTVKPLQGMGGYYRRGGTVVMTRDIYDAGERSRVMFHELTHWLHMEGEQAYRDAVRSHFEARTAGETVVQLPGYGPSTRGKTDRWYEAYAGRIYPSESRAEGIEVPTRYMEWLVMDPKKAADYWNDPAFRETMTLVLRGLF